MLRFNNLVSKPRLIFVCFLLLLCIRDSVGSNYFAYIHGKEPVKQVTERPLSVFKSKLLRLCALYARGHRAQERLIALDVDRIAVGRRLDEPPQICRPVLLQMEEAARQNQLQIEDQAPAMVIYGNENQ